MVLRVGLGERFSVGSGAAVLGRIRQTCFGEPSLNIPVGNRTESFSNLLGRASIEQRGEDCQQGGKSPSVVMVLDRFETPKGGLQDFGTTWQA